MGVAFFGLNSIVTLSAIACERYIVITSSSCRPVVAKWRITRRQAQKVKQFITFRSSSIEIWLIELDAGLCWDLAPLRRPGLPAFTFWMVLLPAGRSSSHLLLGLHFTNAVQSALLLLPLVLRILLARFRFDVLLCGHFPVHPALVQGDHPSNYDERRHDNFQQIYRDLP